ncbi:hypothetical protein PHMEG_0007944 [Phytophthora megakarya]|uniref:PiggyBac transposable element-derived protein domain-containing protein n=1 Tax=Phytophthora megakarya TaxID=4795 RepID=A0A225WLM1_9STRA|nr:hypothetical protein PHMEG_0007944 [Phytophthora megakarya]
MTDRLGYDRNVVAERKTRPRHIPRDSFTFSRSVTVLGMLAFHWWDRKPVHHLCTGSVMAVSMIRRNVKGTGPTMAPCPKAVTDYQAWMGGVDVHDQLRLQTRRRFGLRSLIDLAMVNAYISHKEACKLPNTSNEAWEWYNVLHKQLHQRKEHDFAGMSSTPSPGSRNRRRKRIGHSLTQFDDWVTVSGVQKRRQRSYEVCALLRGERKKSFQTTFYCDKCSIDDAKCYLCPKASAIFRYGTKHFECGLTIPSTLGKRVVLRRPGKKTDVRKKTRRGLLYEEKCEADDELRRGSDGCSDADTEFDL